VFDAPEHSGKRVPLIKRVIAIEGSVVELVNGLVHVDGNALDEPYTFGGEATWPASDETRWVVPPGYLFVLGDHRALSADSRSFGPIDASSVIGRAWLRFYPLEDAAVLTSAE
jgi:signal peptidase I